MNMTAEQIIQEQSRLEQEREPYESLKQLCTQLSYPGRSDAWSLFGIDEGKANNKTRKIYDPTAIAGLDTWTNGIMGHYMPREVNWFASQMADSRMMTSKTVRKWLQDTDEHLRSTINSSNYYEQKKTAIADAGAIGDSFMFIDEDKETGKQMVQVPHPRELWTRRDFWGRTVCLHHKFQKTIRELRAEFGEKALSESQQIALKDAPNTKTEVIHGVYKNSDYNPNVIGVKNMRWQHYYVNVSAKQIMRQTGTATINPIPWSLNRPSHEQYGRGIVSQMLIEILTVNFMSKDLLIASQVAARPPMLITSALKHKIDLGAGAVNFVSSQDTQGLKMGDLIARLVDSSGYPFGEQNHERWQRMVENRFGVPLFLAMNSAESPQKTAFEIRQRQAERAALMSPFLGTLGTTTDAEFDRIYSIELESGRAPEPPQEVLGAQNGRIDLQYIGPLAQLLKQYYETGNLLSTIANIQAVLMVPQFADAATVIDSDELMRKILRSSNAPEDIILSEEDVAEIKAIAQQQAEQERAMAMASQAASAVPDLSKKIESDSVLGALAAA